MGSVSESGVAESLEPIKMSSGGDLRDFGTLALDNKQPARMTLRSMRDEPLPLRLFWSNKSGGEKQVSSDRSGSSTVEGHHVVLSTLEASGSATAAASKDELVQALHVLLPPRGTVIVIVQAVLAEGYGPGGAGGRPHAGKMLTDTSGPLGGAIPFGRVAITPTNTRGGEGTRYLDAVERGSASARAPQAHASAVQLLWRPPPPAAATLRLEPPDLAFNNVLVGVAAEVAPSAKFEIVNTGQTEMNFMLMLRREESDERNDGRGKRDSEKDRKGSGALDRSEKEKGLHLKEKESIREGAADGSAIKEKKLGRVGEAVGTAVQGPVVSSEKKLEKKPREERDKERGEGGGAKLAPGEGGSQSVPLLLHPRNGFIPAGGKCSVEVRCVAPLPGWQRYVVVVRNLSQQSSGGQQDHKMAIRVQGVHPHYLDFPDLRQAALERPLISTPAAGGADAKDGKEKKAAEGLELAFGLCHIIQQPEKGGCGGGGGRRRAAAAADRR